MLHFLINRAMDVAQFGMERSAAKQRELDAARAVQEQREKLARINRFIESERQTYLNRQTSGGTDVDESHGD
jgi:hypothetical protein